jgi:hypothetical protein
MSTMEDAAAYEVLQELTTPRPIAEWHEEMGSVLWWCFTVVPESIGVPGTRGKLRLLGEPPYVGSPLDLGFTVEAHTTTRVITQSNQEHDPEPVIHRIQAGGWPGYHTHFTPLPVPLSPQETASD